MAALSHNRPTGTIIRSNKDMRAHTTISRSGNHGNHKNHSASYRSGSCRRRGNLVSRRAMLTQRECNYSEVVRIPAVLEFYRGSVGYLGVRVSDHHGPIRKMILSSLLVRGSNTDWEKPSADDSSRDFTPHKKIQSSESDMIGASNGRIWEMDLRP